MSCPSAVSSAEQATSFKQMRATRAGLLVIGLYSVALGHAAAVEPIKPVSGPWSAGAGFPFASKPNKTRRSVSGIACPSSATGERTCLFVFDEGTEARFGVLAEGSLKPLDEEVILIPNDGELDAEGAALEGRNFYITGSHSPKRSNCKSNPDSRHVIRIRRDPATGQVATDDTGKFDIRATGALWDLMGREPKLMSFIGERKCLGTEPPEDKPELKGQRGANIEALAARGGRLFFGFRGPAMDGRAPILAVDAATLFDGVAAATTTTMLDIGPRRGIRDMQAVADGILVLAGPDDDKGSADAGWVVGLWDGQTTPNGEGALRNPVPLDLDGLVRNECDKEIKPEALSVWEESASHFKVVILSDGMCDGGPLLFNVPR